MASYLFSMPPQFRLPQNEDNNRTYIIGCYEVYIYIYLILIEPLEQYLAYSKCYLNTIS